MPSHSRTLPSNLLIVFRHYREDLYSHRSRDPHKKRPDWFSNLLCMASLLNAIEESNHSNNVRLLLWYDGTEEDFATDPLVNLVTARANDLNVDYHRYPYGRSKDTSGANQSFSVLLNYLATQVHEDLVYLVENDYLHRQSAISALFEAFISLDDADYVNLADHRDYYHLPIHKSHHTSLRYSPNFLYKTCLTSTGTFAARTATLIRDLTEIINKPDYSFFTRLTGIHGRILYTSVPGQAAHCMLHLMPPGVNWDLVAKDTLVRMTNVSI